MSVKRNITSYVELSLEIETEVEIYFHMNIRQL